MRDVTAEEKTREQTFNRNHGKISPDETVRQVPPISLGDLLTRYSRFILIGTPGSGKTTLLHRAALGFAENRANTDLGWNGKPLLPIFTRLRNFGVFLAQHHAEFPAPCPGALVSYLENQYREGERGDLLPISLTGGCKKGIVLY